MKNNTVNILFCGRGGQGVLKASEVVAEAAQLSGYHVKKSEMHGMSQRGGSVESHLRFGKEVNSPLIPRGRADFLVSFDRGEHAAKKNFLKPKGVDLVKYLEEAGRIVPNKRQVNVFLLGRLARYLEIDPKSWTAALERVFSTGYLEENKKAFYLGIGE